MPLLILLVLSLLLTACGDSPPRYKPLAQDSVVLAFGDSVTHGTGAGKGEDFPSLLAKSTGWKVVNAGVPGDTVSEACGRIAGLLQKHEPDLVIVELGGNDFLRRQSASQVKGASSRNYYRLSPFRSRACGQFGRF